MPLKKKKTRSGRSASLYIREVNVAQLNVIFPPGSIAIKRDTNYVNSNVIPTDLFKYIIYFLSHSKVVIM